MEIIILAPAPSASVYVALQLCAGRNDRRDRWAFLPLIFRLFCRSQWNFQRR